MFLTFPFVDVLVIDKSTGENQRESNNKTNKLNYYSICVKMWITDYNISFRYSNHIVTVLYSVIHIHTVLQEQGLSKFLVNLYYISSSGG